MRALARLRAVLVVGSAIGASVGAVFVGSVSAAASSAVRTSTSNRRAARLDTARLLRGLRLPTAARRSPGEPVGDGGSLKPLPALMATPARADVHAWRLVPGSPPSVLAYIEAHPPAGSRLYATGSAYTGRSGRSVESLDYGWPAIPGVIGARELAVSVTFVSRTTTAVLAQAESDWIVPRAPSERVPVAAHEIDITSATPGGPTTISLHLTNAAKVRRIVGLINAMPIVQPGAYSCPGLTNPGARVLTFKFRARVSGQLLAQATYIDYPGLSAPSGLCNPIALRIRGHVRDPLIGPDFVRQAEQVLGVSLTRGS
jgi:hypothetical protein